MVARLKIEVLKGEILCHGCNFKCRGFDCHDLLLKWKGFSLPPATVFE